MQIQEVDVFIGKDGRVRVEVRGAKGPSCLDLTADLERVLGGEVESREMTAESRECAHGIVEDRLRQGN